MGNIQGAYLKGGSGTLNVWCNGDMLCVAPDHINYSKILEKVVAGDFDGIEPMLNIAKGIEEYTFGKIVIRNGQLFYGEHEIRNTLVDRILGNMKDGTCFKRYIAFLDKLLENPSSRSLDQLYDFLKYTCLRIADDGFVYAYKGITSDWKDAYTGRIDNSVGKTITMPRNLISDDPDHACHKGLHCGTIKYAREYSGSRLVIVKVHPKDVVSVPKDCTWQKCRVCEYTVVAECDYDGNPVGDWKFSSVGADDVVPQMHIGYGFTNSIDDEYETNEVTSTERVYDDSPSVTYKPDNCEDREEEWDYDSEDEDNEECCDDCGELLSDCCCEDEDDDSDEYCDCGCYLNADGSCDTCDEDDEEEEELCQECMEYYSPSDGTGICDECAGIVDDEEDLDEEEFGDDDEDDEEEECLYCDNIPDNGLEVCDECRTAEEVEERQDKEDVEPIKPLVLPEPLKPAELPVPQPRKKWWQIGW